MTISKLVKERPIIFSTDMVKAILDGQKTMTRRVIKPQPNKGMECKGMIFNWMGKAQAEFDSVPEYDEEGKHYYPYGCYTYHPLCPHGQVGDRLWVRETFYESNVSGIIYKASELPSHYNDDGSPAYAFRSWKPSIHMPRWASRILLEITNIKAERLQEITEGDCYAGGIERHTDRGNNIFWFEVAGAYHGETQSLTPVEAYMKLWDSLNAKRGYGWTKNPFVWCIFFRRVKSNNA